MEDLNPPQVNTSLNLSIISTCQHRLSPTRETITGAAGDSIHCGGQERQTAKQEGVVRMEDFNRITSQHNKIIEMLVAMYENVNAMQNKLININNSNLETEPARQKRKFDCYNWSNAIRVDERFANCDEDLYKRANGNPKSKISRAFFPTGPSDMSLIVKDGYHWRKYGQKVTRDNPSPRAYFKCSFAPSCPVKKKVQRSVENPTILVATYEGEHNHHCSTQAKNRASSALGTSNSPTIIPLKPSSCSSPSSVLDSFQLPRVCRSSSASKRTPDPHELCGVVSGGYMPQFLVKQMVFTLTSDPNFTATLAAAISGKILEQELGQDWGQEGKL